MRSSEIDITEELKAQMRSYMIKLEKSFPSYSLSKVVFKWRGL